jgi:hypothetical protein
MTTREIAQELFDSYVISYGNQYFEAKQHALKVLHIMALSNNMSYKEYCEILKELDKI